MNKVSKESGLDGVEDSNNLESFGVDAHDESWTREFLTWRVLCPKLFLGTWRRLRREEPVTSLLYVGEYFIRFGVNVVLLHVLRHPAIALILP